MWRTNLFAITAASFIGFTGFTLVMPFLPLYFQELGVSDVGDIALWSGLSLGVTPALTAILAPFWGRLGDRFGNKIMVERSLASFVIVMASMAFVTEAWQVLALRSVQGLFAGYGALSLAMAIESAPPDRAAYALGFVQTAQRMGPALGPLIGGAVAQFVGLRRAFLVTAVFYFVALILVFFMYRERARPAAAAQTGRVTFRSVLAFENFILLLAVVFALQFVDRSFGPVLPLYIAQLGTPLDRVPIIAGVLFSIAAGAGAVGHHFCGRLLRHAPARHVIAAAAAVAAIGAAGYVVAGGTGLLIVATPLFGVALGVATTATYTAASSTLPGTARGAGFGLLTTASLTGLALSPIVSGFLGATSIRAVFLLDVVALATLAVLVLRLMITSPIIGTTQAPATDEL
ncbi:MAG: MFS transporter [Acidobacteria bacterium]|nr:MFS transporter [Acidobacteriota bacterium]MCA1652143.1 MFS transporter [Acidobacteriota bacterium]